MRKHGELWVTFSVTGADVVLPPLSSAPTFKEGLWQSTCFELFVAGTTGPSYEEWNFSPSGDWWHAEFKDYRIQTENTARPAAPQIRTATHSGVRIEIRVPAFSLPHSACAPCAVLKHQSGEISYWAMEHSGNKADFHRRDSFVLHL
ncbi:MAG: DOMON-like domain-containing protein [Bdellovibrionales bacterium]|nr:DOMON-like domain-containing protein [Bdellovibrionales bacterium]